ncbi:hypothetical protein MMC14_001087 [Varicellaria rhodocarpa]|nr:hypothetical protein [Varicellaria rhodocarpa]
MSYYDRSKKRPRVPSESEGEEEEEADGYRAQPIPSMSVQRNYTHTSPTLPHSLPLHALPLYNANPDPESNNDMNQFSFSEYTPEPFLPSPRTLPPIELDPVTLYPRAPYTIPQDPALQYPALQHPAFQYPAPGGMSSDNDRNQFQFSFSRAMTRELDQDHTFALNPQTNGHSQPSGAGNLSPFEDDQGRLPAGWERRTVTMTYYVNDTTRSSTWDRPQPTMANEANQGPLPSEARQNVDPAEASRPRFMPSKQHLHEVIKAKMILAGDELQYKGSDDVHCTITVRGITSRHFLNVTVIFLPDPTVASASSSVPQPPIRVERDNIRNPTALENVLLEHYGTDTSLLKKKWRKTWDSFVVVRNGQEIGTFADLRQIVGEQRIAAMG